jgi:hypothetical protein
MIRLSNKYTIRRQILFTPQLSSLASAETPAAASLCLWYLNQSDPRPRIDYGVIRWCASGAWRRLVLHFLLGAFRCRAAAAASATPTRGQAVVAAATTCVFVVSGLHIDYADPLLSSTVRATSSSKIRSPRPSTVMRAAPLEDGPVLAPTLVAPAQPWSGTSFTVEARDSWGDAAAGGEGRREGGDLLRWWLGF